MYAAASSPVRYGSSDIYSKFLPHKGLRFMFIAGPNSTARFSAAASAPKASPCSAAISLSKDAANPTEVGKQVASIESFNPRWSPPSACFLSPWGPSETMTSGTPRRSTLLKRQKSFPEHNPAFSSGVISANTFLISISTSEFILLYYLIDYFILICGTSQPYIGNLRYRIYRRPLPC